MKLSPNEIAWLVLNAGWLPGDEARQMVAVILAESSGETDVLARGSTTTESTGNWDHGLAQISNRWHGDKLETMGQWRDPIKNLSMAYKIFTDSSRSFSPWNVTKIPPGGTVAAYEKYLPDADLALAHPIKPPMHMFVSFEAINNSIRSLGQEALKIHAIVDVIRSKFK